MFQLQAFSWHIQVHVIGFISIRLIPVSEDEVDILIQNQFNFDRSSLAFELFVAISKCIRMCGRESGAQNWQGISYRCSGHHKR